MIAVGTRPRVLVVANDRVERTRLQFASCSELELLVEDSLLGAVNRLGLEEFDALVLDPDENLPTVMKALLGLLQRLPRVQVMLLQTKKDRRLFAGSGVQPVTISRHNLVRSVLDGLACPSSPAN